MHEIDYTSPEFWATAPEGATHWLEESETDLPGWMKHEAGKWFYMGDGSSHWVETEPDADTFSTMTARPVAWDGQGLPPVGIPVEWIECNQTGWQEVVVLAYANGDAWIKPKDKPSIIVGNPSGFRPIRTPEQIAAEEREKAIQEMKHAFDSVSDDLMPTTNVYLNTLFGAIYDSGFRKVEGEQP